MSYSIFKFSAKPITSAEIAPFLSELIANITARTKPSAVILFGSFARDQGTDLSDLDVAVIYPDGQLKGARHALYHGGRLCSWPLDLLLFDQETFAKRKDLGGVSHLIREEGKILFGDIKL